MSDFQLPQVGDRLSLPSVVADYTMKGYNVPPEPCTVVFVNARNGWFLVQFHRSGLLEGFKPPFSVHRPSTEQQKAAYQAYNRKRKERGQKYQRKAVGL